MADCHSSQSGFVLVQALALVPLLLIAVIAAAGIQYAIKRKLTAQTLCVRAATDLQQDLAKTLDQLIKLNPRARRLRIQRANADRAWRKALASRIPHAIAVTSAIRTAVILAQTALQAEQQRLLLSARAHRSEHLRRLQMDGARITHAPIRSRHYYIRPLAVEPIPQTSLSPDYVTVTQFSYFQQHRFEFDVNVAPAFWQQPLIQKTLCSVSLSGKEGAWKPQIIAASALSKSQWF